MALLTEENKNWLSLRYPHLIIDTGGIFGLFEFKATYDVKSGQFFLGEHDGMQLSGSFKINIKERLSAVTSRLPALYVEGVEPTANRHINPDHSACLCIPLEEDDFLTPQFQFVRFIEELVIPFLYGQVFYSMEGRWPWPDYAHGAVGILESYGKIKKPEKINDCLQKLSQDSKAWPSIRAELYKKGDVKGGFPCFCEKGDHRRRCHPNALLGIRQLKDDIKNHGITYSEEELDKMLKIYTNDIRAFNPLVRSVHLSTQAAHRYTVVGSSSPDLSHF